MTVTSSTTAQPHLDYPPPKDGWERIVKPHHVVRIGTLAKTGTIVSVDAQNLIAHVRCTTADPAESIILRLPVGLLGPGPGVSPGVHQGAQGVLQYQGAGQGVHQGVTGGVTGATASVTDSRADADVASADVASAGIGSAGIESGSAAGASGAAIAGTSVGAPSSDNIQMPMISPPGRAERGGRGSRDGGEQLSALELSAPASSPSDPSLGQLASELRGVASTNRRTPNDFSSRYDRSDFGISGMRGDQTGDRTGGPDRTGGLTGGRGTGSPLGGGPPNLPVESSFRRQLFAEAESRERQQQPRQEQNLVPGMSGLPGISESDSPERAQGSTQGIGGIGEGGVSTTADIGGDASAQRNGASRHHGSHHNNHHNNRHGHSQHGHSNRHGHGHGQSRHGGSHTGHQQSRQPPPSGTAATNAVPATLDDILTQTRRDYLWTQLPRSSPANLDTKECVMCLLDFEPTDDVLRMPCLHSFHDHCVRDWFLARGTCPICSLDVCEIYLHTRE